MKIMLGMLLNLLDSLDQIVVEESKQILGVLRDLITKLSGENGNKWLEELKKFLRRETCWVMTTLEQLIAAGKYSYVNSNVTHDRFPIPENFVLGADPKVFYFNRFITSEDVVKEMDKLGYEPAMSWDLLDYGAKNPEEHRRFIIVALGSVGKVGVHRYAMCLTLGDSRRGVGMGEFDHGWGNEFCFLGVRKKVV